MATSRDTIRQARIELGARIDELAARVQALESGGPAPVPDEPQPQPEPEPIPRPGPQPPEPRPDPEPSPTLPPSDGERSAYILDVRGEDEEAISDALGRVPDNAVAVFPPGREYHCERRIQGLWERRNLLIDGNGCTFHTTARLKFDHRLKPWSGPNPNWLIYNCVNVRLENMRAVGPFDLPPPRSLAKIPNDVGEDVEVSEANAGFGVYGGDGIWIVDCETEAVWGDGVSSGPPSYVFAGDEVTRNLHVIRHKVRRVARHALGLAGGIGVWVEDGDFEDLWYIGIDTETDNESQPITDHHYLRNRISGYTHGAIVVPVAREAETRGIEIRGNHIETRPDSICHPPIWIGIYPDNPYRFGDVTVEENDVVAMGPAVQLHNVDGGSVRYNRFRRLADTVGCNADPIIVTNSSGVITEPNEVVAVSA